jgi:hypothetical protein
MSSGDVQNVLENVGLFCGKYGEVCGLQMSSFHIKGRGSEVSVCLKTVMVKIIQGDQKVSVHLIIKIRKVLGRI